MDRKTINKDYLSDKPHSFGGKKECMNIITTKVNQILIKLYHIMIYIQDLNNIENLKNINQYMSIKARTFPIRCNLLY